MASGIGKVRLFNTTPSKFTLAAGEFFYSLRRIASSAIGLHDNHHAVCPATDMHGAGFQSEGPSMNGDISELFTRFVRPLPQGVCDRGESQLGGGLVAW